MGFSKEDVADTTNVVWLDLDPPASIPSTDVELVAEAERRFEECVALGLAPSVFLFSGRGCWAYWKLDRNIAQAEAELLMRRLCVLFRREGSEWDIGRIARMPGSVNEKTRLVVLRDGCGGCPLEPREAGFAASRTRQRRRRTGACFGAAAVRFSPRAHAHRRAGGLRA